MPTGALTVRPATRIAVLAFCSLLTINVLRSQEGTAPPTPEQLAAMERVRPQIDAIWADVRAPDPPGGGNPLEFWDVTGKLIAIGPAAIPFLTSELELMDADTFHFCAYSLGRLGGSEAEKALRKAIRIADSGGGRFGQACKRYALYGLALLGKPDVVESMLSGGAYQYGAEMIADMPLAAQLAEMIGPPAAPLLDKQLDAFKSDPAAVPNLEEALIALGHTREPSVIPKIEPFLTSKFPKIRVQAAEAVARLGEPRLCEELLPLLGSADEHERLLVAHTFERWKPEPCYKAMVGRLEVESDVAIRGSLYRAIASMGGESALDVLRLYLGSNDQFDRGAVIDFIGKIGSKKGLNMLRPMLSHNNPDTRLRAMGAIAAIGGDGATETLLALAGDNRRSTATSAQEVLAGMGVKRVAPRVASELLDLVREPVGNTNLRPVILRLSEALVALDYPAPAADLKAAAALQSDPMILETLSSCVRRLELLAKNGNDVAAWAAEMASGFPEVRRLAERRVAEIGSPAAVRALTARLARGDLPPEDRAAVLTAIGEARTEGAASLVERHLADPAFDAWDQASARSAAAWAARRIGGDRMVRALRESAVRRDGRDWATLVYLALVDKAAAIPTLKTLRLVRLRYPQPNFGTEAPMLDAILIDLAAGREPSRFDVAPDLLFAME
jgi:HEAT repeat protein